MMKKAWKKYDGPLHPGMHIRGKWNGHRYFIKRKLGQGSIGTVYLCVRNGHEVALKISDKTASITTEINVLKRLNQVQEKRLGPDLLDADDWISPRGITYYFYVMEYVQGESINAFLKRRGYEWVGVFMLQLLGDLQKLHETGWVVGDLKVENLIVTSPTPRIRWIDVGGTTQMGRAVKEYTEFYDRGYWGLGTRRAEASYDLFSLAMVFLRIFDPKPFERKKDVLYHISRRLHDIPSLKLYKSCLKKALMGKYASSAQMKQDIETVIHNENKKKEQRKNRTPFIVESIGLFILAFIYYLSSLFLP